MAYYFSLYEVLKVHPASSFLRKVDAVKSQLLRFYFLSSMRFQCSASDESTSSAVLIFEISDAIISSYVSGAEGIRTPDPLLARQVLSQLSYNPMVMSFLYSVWILLIQWA